MVAFRRILPATNALEVEAPRRVLITGVTGQDGWYLARRLLDLGHQVKGTTHRSESSGWLDVGRTRIEVLRVDLTQSKEIEDLVREERPDEIYNLAARASSAQLFDDPLATAEINGLAVARLLEAIRQHSPKARFCQASSSEIFTGVNETPQDESTPRVPTNAYGAAKAFADHLVAAYRFTHGIFACSAVLYPHESPRRPPHFLMRKVTRAAARIRAGRETELTLGDLSAVRDWGYAADYVEGMRRILRIDEPRDFILATGERHTVMDVCEAAFRHVGLDWRRHVIVDTGLKRAAEVAPRIGNSRRARSELGWAPTLAFEELVTSLVDEESAALQP
jgi:GDPmannose 4,6-dehydratase